MADDLPDLRSRIRLDTSDLAAAAVQARAAGAAIKHGLDTNDANRGLVESGVRLAAIVGVADLVRGAVGRLSGSGAGGFPDLSFGAGQVAEKVTAAAAAMTAGAGTVGMLAVAAGGLGAALGAAVGGALLLKAAVGPQLTGQAQAGMAGLQSQLQGVANKLGVTASVSGSMGSVFSTLHGVVGQLGPTLQSAAGGVSNLTGQFRDFITNGASPFGQALAMLPSVVGPAISGLGTVGLNVGGILSGAFVALGPAIQPVILMVQQLTSGLQDAAMGSGFSAFVQQLTPIIAQLGPTLSSVGVALSSLLGQAAGLAGPVLTVIRTLADTLATLFQSADFGAFVDNIGNALLGLMPLLSALGPLLGTVFATLSGQIVALVPIIVPALTQFAQLFAQILVGISPLLGPIIQLASVLVGALIPPLYALIMAVKSALLPVFPAIQAAITAAAPAFASMAGAVGQVVGALAPLLPMLINALAPILPLVFGAVAQLAPVFVQLVNALMPLIPPLLQIVTTLLPPLVGLVVAVAVPIVQLAARLVTALMPALLIVTGALNGVAGVLATVIGWFGRLVGSVIDAVAGVLTTIIGLPGKIVAGIGRLDMLLVSAGKDLIMGMVHGIENAAGAVGEAAKNAAKAAVDGVKHFLGISSPSRLFRDEVGAMVGAGMAEGITGSIGQVSRAAAGLAQSAASAASGAAASMSIGASAGSANRAGGGVAVHLADGMGWLRDFITVTADGVVQDQAAIISRGVA